MRRRWRRREALPARHPLKICGSFLGHPPPRGTRQRWPSAAGIGFASLNLSAEFSRASCEIALVAKVVTCGCVTHALGARPGSGARRDAADCHHPSRDADTELRGADGRGQSRSPFSRCSARNAASCRKMTTASTAYVGSLKFEKCLPSLKSRRLRRLRRLPLYSE